MYSKTLKTVFRSFLATLVVGAFIFNSCSDATSEEFDSNSSLDLQTSLNKI